MKHLLQLMGACVALCALACAAPTKTQTQDAAPVEQGSTTSSFPADLAGYYHEGDWGAIVIRSMGGDRVRATYTHDQGTIEGRWVGDKIVGWWCEAPSRAPTNDAGDVELTFIKEGGTTRIDGRWRYGDSSNEPEWREDWDLYRSSQVEPPAELVARFNDNSAFCAKP